MKTSWVNCDNQISLKFSSSPFSGAAFRLHQSHESETPIINQMLYNHETNPRLRIGVVTSVWSTSTRLHLVLKAGVSSSLYPSVIGQNNWGLLFSSKFD